MKISKNEVVVNILIRPALALAMGILISCYTIQDPIDIEKIRTDVLTYASEIMPERHVKKLKPAFFSVFYLDDVCVAHVPYKSYAGESFMKSSLVVIYERSNGDWKYKTFVPYYYNIAKIEGSQNYFLSSNEICEPNGACNSYHEISIFINNDFEPMYSYSGFDRFNYFDRFLSLEKKDDVQEAIGDTLTSKVELKDFVFVKNQLKSFELKKQVSILTGIQDSLITRDSQSTRVIDVDR